MFLLSADHLPDPLVVWGVLQRAIGLLFVIAHASLIPQILSLIGTGTTFPADRRLQALSEDLPGPGKYLRTPTLFWLSTHESFIRLVPWLGVLGGAMAVYGGPYALPGLVLAWLCFLSIEQTALTIFPWDTMLLEVGFLAMFLPATAALPELRAEALPAPTVAFMFRWTAARLMWGFGRMKFVGATRDDSLYLRGFMVWMPMPSRLGWHMQHAPQWLLRLSLYFMFFSEVVAPGLALLPGEFRLLGFAGLVGLMVGIQLTGNWGYFNLGYICLCVCLLDPTSTLGDLTKPGALTGSLGTVATHVSMGFLFLLSLLYLPMNSWVTRSWVHWPFDDVAYGKRWVSRLVAFARFFSPFRIVSGYGVFPPNAEPPMRMAPTFEGSEDGVTWKAYRYPFLPTHEDDPPAVVAPHHPRLDHAAMYALYMTDQTILTSVTGDGSAHSAYTRYSWLERALQGILRGDPVVKGTFATDPFPEQPPKYARVSLYALTPCSHAHRRATGHWWHRRRVGALIPPRQLDEGVERHWQPVPDLFHPDWVDRKRQAPTLRAMLAAHHKGAPAQEAVLTGAQGLDATDVARFWDEFVPFVQQERGDWSRVRERVQALEARFVLDERVRFERLLARFAWLLRGPCEPHVWGTREPTVPKLTNYRFELLLQEAVLDGRERFEAMLADPSLLAARHAQSTDASQLYVVALLRWEMIDYTIRSFRWVELVAQLKAKNTPGIVEFYDLLRTQVPTDEEWLPRAPRLPDGEWDMSELIGGTEAQALVADQAPST